MKPLERKDTTSQNSLVSEIGCRKTYDHWLRTAATSPLLWRAWGYQERILSPRVIQYTSEELVWECGTRKLCECGLEDYTGIMGYEKEAFSVVRNYRLGKSKLPYQNFQTEAWHRLIAGYSALDLTYSSDKLPAFSGIAAWFVDPNQYVAGLRKDHLSIDLGWTVMQGGRRPHAYRAPSWSWTSADAYLSDGKTQWREHVPLLSVIEASCTLQGPDSFGRIVAGHIIVEG